MPTDRILVALDRAHERRSDAGTTRCARSLLAALRARDDVRVMDLGGGPPVRPGTLRRRFTTLRLDFWWYPVEARRRAAALHAHVQHCPTPRAPLTRGRPPLVVTIHDLASLRFPETLTPWTRMYEHATLPRVVRAADRIIVPSHDTANDVQILLRVPAGKIRHVPNGIDDFFFSDDSSDPLLDFTYVLFVGTPQPRKNLERLAAALHSLRARGYPHRLVVAGADGWGHVPLDREGVHLLGRVTDANLKRLYRNAACVAVTSLHEGFGLPALEAMASGTPVVASAAGALPEVTGGAAVLVDPLDVESIADGIIRALERRDDLVQAGRARAKSFSWRTAAAQTLDVYRDLV